MNDITIKNKKNQIKNQKSTPVTEPIPEPESIKTSPSDDIIAIWLGWRDSNPRMLGPEPSALPLGDTPSLYVL